MRTMILPSSLRRLLPLLQPPRRHPRQHQRITAFCLLAFVTALRMAWWDIVATTGGGGGGGHLLYLRHIVGHHHVSAPLGQQQREDPGVVRDRRLQRPDDLSPSLSRFGWLTENDIDLGMDSYSAAWYMSRQLFRDVNVSAIQSLEGACFVVYRDHDDAVRMTLDYLDYAVEHGSQWWKTLGCPHDPVAVNVTVSAYRHYVQKHLHRSNESGAIVKPSSIVRPTIALVAFSQLRDDPPDPDAERTTTTTTSVRDLQDRNRQVTVYSLAATLASLIRIGFGRIVVVGHASDDDAVVNEAFQFLQRQDGNGNHEGGRSNLHDGPHATTTTRGSELAFVRPTPEMMADGGEEVQHNVPKGALAGLQHAMWGNDAEWTQQWLGINKTAQDWKYVYYTEQDSVLTVRDSALPHLHRALNDGLIVIPHRLQPVPHQLDVPRTISQFESFLTNDFKSPQWVGGHATDHCCDTQERRVFDPHLLLQGYAPCGAPWWQCGFSDTNGELGNHSRLSRYDVIRLVDGTGVAAIAGSAHGRRCILQTEPCRHYRRDDNAAAVADSIAAAIE